MTKQTVSFTILLLGVMLSSSVVATCAQQTEEPSAKLKAFLESDAELQDYSKNGYTSRFAGEFRSMPQDLRLELRRELPEFTFHIAKMAVLIDPPQKNYDLILITNSQTGAVCGFIWGSYWTIPPSRSFGGLLNGYQTKSTNGGLDKIKSLAKLIAFTTDGEVGKATSKEGKLKVELLRGDGVFRILEIKIDKQLRLGRLSITGTDGKKPRYFV